MKIGFIGLGLMGSPIAANLVKAGYEVLAWNRSPEKIEPLTALGARPVSRPVDAAEADLVLTMLADDRAVEAVVFGDGGILAATKPPIHVSLSTISLALADRLDEAHRAAGGGYVSAPVFGRPPAAEARELFIVAAGAPAALATCRPLFEAIGQRSFIVGERPSLANTVKLCGNFMIMSVVESLGEAMTLGDRHGLPKAALLDVLTNTLFGARIYQSYGPMLVEERFRPAGFPAPLGLKDMNLVEAAAADAGVPMPVLSLVRDRLRATIAREGEDIDWAGIAKVIDDDARR